MHFAIYACVHPQRLAQVRLETVIVDDADQQVTLGNEADADEKAREWTFPGGLPAAPLKVSDAWVRRAATKFKVHPLVVVGRLQKQGDLSWRTSLVRNADTVSAQLASWN